MSKAKLKKKRFWCPEYGIMSHYPSYSIAKNYTGKYVRCRTCGRRVMPRAIVHRGFGEESFEGDWHIPRHKTKPRTKEIT